MINYPNKKTTIKKNSVVSYNNRGINFEEAINQTNKYYLDHEIAIIHKKPTPIKVVKVDYPSRNKAKIIEAYYTVPSTTDYNGIYKNKYIDFETKEIKSRTSLTLTVFHAHQIKHLEMVEKHGGISFILVNFKSIDKIFLLETKYLIKFFQRQINGRKSISLSEFEEFGHLITFSYAPEVPYLNIVDKLIESKKDK